MDVTLCSILLALQIPLQTSFHQTHGFRVVDSQMHAVRCADSFRGVADMLQGVPRTACSCSFTTQLVVAVVLQILARLRRPKTGNDDDEVYLAILLQLLTSSQTKQTAADIITKYGGMLVFLNGARVHKRTPRTWCISMWLLCHHTSFPSGTKLKNVDILLQMRALKTLSGLLCPDFSSMTNNEHAVQQYFEDMAKSKDDCVPMDTQLDDMRAVLMLMRVLLRHIDSTAMYPLWQLEEHPAQHNQARRMKPWPRPSPDDWENNSEMACRACIAVVWVSSIQNHAAPATLDTAELSEPDDVLDLLWWLVAHLIAGHLVDMMLTVSTPLLLLLKTAQASDKTPAGAFREVLLKAVTERHQLDREQHELEPPITHSPAHQYTSKTSDIIGSPPETAQKPLPDSADGLPALPASEEHPADRAAAKRAKKLRRKVRKQQAQHADTQDGQHTDRPASNEAGKQSTVSHNTTSESAQLQQESIQSNTPHTAQQCQSYVSPTSVASCTQGFSPGSPCSQAELVAAQDSAANAHHIAETTHQHMLIDNSARVRQQTAAPSQETVTSLAAAQPKGVSSTNVALTEASSQPTVPAGTGRAAVVNYVQQSLRCPITKAVMQYPVIAADGYTYEARAITVWLQHNTASPVDGIPFAHHHTVANRVIRDVMQW